MFTFPQNKLSQKPALAIALLFCLLILMLVITSLIVYFVGGKFTNPAAGLRICTVIQDVLVFVFPAIAIAMVSTRFPASLLGVNKHPDLRMTILAILALLLSVPAMNIIVEWNENLSLPACMAEIEKAMRTMEQNAQESIKLILGNTNIAGLIVNVLIIGVLAGFSEELFFRGALQRLLTSAGKCPHLMIWLTAFLFSAFHLQFFGFFPRMILGAFFGYLLWWSGSLWLPILIHALNNSIVVISQWVSENRVNPTDINKLGTDLSSSSSIIMISVSIVATFFIIYMLVKRSKQLQ